MSAYDPWASTAHTASEPERGYYDECDRCEGNGLVIDNRTEELVDCTACEGTGTIWIDAADDEYEPDEDDE